VVTFGEDSGTESVGSAHVGATGAEDIAAAGDEPNDRAAALAEIATGPLAEHPAGYERLHGELRAALAEIDDA
jgi:hypothetical protein